MAEGVKMPKEKIHPQYYQATVTCSTCGNTFKTGSTLKEIKVDSCSNCHPFYTGQQKFVQAAGRVEKFQKRLAEQEKAKKNLEKVEANRKATEVEKQKAKEEKLEARKLEIKKIVELKDTTVKKTSQSKTEEKPKETVKVSSKKDTAVKKPAVKKEKPAPKGEVKSKEVASKEVKKAKETVSKAKAESAKPVKTADLGLNSKLTDLLVAAGLTTAKKIAAKKEEDFKEIKGIGPKAVSDIKIALKIVGLSLKA